MKQDFARVKCVDGAQKWFVMSTNLIFRFCLRENRSENEMMETDKTRSIFFLFPLYNFKFHY